MVWSRDEGNKRFPNPNPFSSYTHFHRRKLTKNRMIHMFMTSLSMKTALGRSYLSY